MTGGRVITRTFETEATLTADSGASESPDPGPSTGGRTAAAEKAVRELLAHLNFSAGTFEPKLYANCDRAAAALDGPLLAGLSQTLDAVAGEGPVFSDVTQARRVLTLAAERVLPGYRQHHADLLAHLPEETSAQPYFVARVLEATLRGAAAESSDEAAAEAAIGELNDFLGYRPVAVLENGRRSMPFDHERHAPLPLYVAGAGVATGPYHDVLQASLELLRQTPEDLRSASYFDLDRLDVLAVDLRAHDHLHPANKRTNYMFGEWDPDTIDVGGSYRRFIVRKMILDALVDWVEREEKLDGDEAAGREERLFDAAAALVGTMLMASTISGAGPDSHDSTVSLTTLLPVVARRRDEFYELLISGASGERAARLRASAGRTRQPFGHIRQHVNMTLSRYGARQVQHRELASLYARMGFADAARQEARILPSVSMRFECEIQCRIGTVHRLVDAGTVEEAAALLPDLFELLKRGIECGALVDPWNILGFAGQFPVFSAREDAIPDPRVETLMILVEGVLNAHARTLTEAAARGSDVRQAVGEGFLAVAQWWDQFGSGVIDDLPEVVGMEAYDSATHVADALHDWREAGEASGDVSFWRDHVESFHSAHAYGPVVEALLDRRDFVAAMGLLMQWLGTVEDAGTESSRQSIFALLLRWMALVTSRPAGEVAADASPMATRTQLVTRMLAFLEANADELWGVPQLESVDLAGDADPSDWMETLDDGPDEDDTFGAAYEGVTYKDSTDDGNWGDTLGGDPGTGPGESEFEELTRRVEPRLRFLHTVGQLWQQAAVSVILDAHEGAADLADERVSAAVSGYLTQSQDWQADLVTLLKSVWEQGIDTIAGDQEANIEYDAQLQAKNYLVHQIVVTLICLRNAGRLLRCALPQSQETPKAEKFERRLTRIYRAVLHRDDEAVRAELPTLIAQLERFPLLYVPIENGGDPHQVLRVQTLQSVLRWLLRQLPARGLLRETWHLLRCAARMERNSRPPGPAITEFDRLFEISLRESLETVLSSAATWDTASPEQVATLVGELVEQYQERWLRHSRTMRLSAVDYLRVDGEAAKVAQFIGEYGGELFHASQLTLSHVRAILHHGIDWYLDYLAEFDDPVHPLRLLEDIETGKISRNDVVGVLELIYQIIVDKYDRFLEYNTTTTQSDYGEKLFCFLEFLRLESQYERDEWNLTPLVIAHEVMTRHGLDEAAALWEDEFSQRMAEQADEYPRGLRKLEGEYGMRMPAVADHLSERFIKPLAVNRMLAQVRTAVERSDEGMTSRSPQPDETAQSAFARLRDEIARYMEDRQGSGVDVPDWLQDLQDEADAADSRVLSTGDEERLGRDVRRPMSREDVSQQLERWSEPLRAAAPQDDRRRDRTRREE